MLLKHALPAPARWWVIGVCFIGLGVGVIAQPQRGEETKGALSPRDAEPWAPTDFGKIDPALPTLFVAGDSTASTGNPTHRGWGAVLIDYIDASRFNIINRAVGGRSFRTFTREGRWDQIVEHIEPGDYVIIELGHNDGGDPTRPRSRGDVRGVGEETVTVTRPDGETEIVHTYGWYTRKYIRDTREKGGIPIVSTVTVRNIWGDDKVERGMGQMLDWAKQVAEEEDALFLDHSNITADVYEEMGFDAVQRFFPADHTHTSTEGAILNAETLIAGLKALDGVQPLLDALTEKGKAIPARPPRDHWKTFSPPRPHRGN